MPGITLKRMVLIKSDKENKFKIENVPHDRKVYSKMI